MTFPLDGVRAVLFDMDGTLVDSDAAVARAWTTFAEEHALPLADVLAIAHGAPAASTVRTMLPHLSGATLAQVNERQLALEYEDLADVRATPGAHRVIDLVERLGMPWAVVTSADTRLATKRLRAAGISAPVLVTTDHISVGKPDPEGYVLAARLLGVDPSQCLVVEDAAVGIAAGRAAGARVAALKGLHADLDLTSLDDLADLLAR
jgi:sugar-phosphatase